MEKDEKKRYVCTNENGALIVVLEGIIDFMNSYSLNFKSHFKSGVVRDVEMMASGAVSLSSSPS